MSQETPDYRRQLLICLFLTFTVLAAFWQVNRCDFINYDDEDYITENSHIQNGITTEGIRWAFTTSHAANWHPLTWLSHMLDYQLFGLKPGWHHLANVFFHIANTLLLFLILNRMTRARWQSTFVAALFALHPLHVESVAWVSERKDVLSTFFWMLAMGAYILYVERPVLQRYLPVLIFFALGLMAKPMLVTLPFVLLLLDYWPLQRFQQKRPTHEIQTDSHVSVVKQKTTAKKMHGGKSETKVEKSATSKNRWELIRPVFWEKIPFFALTALSSIITYVTQQKGGAIVSIEAFSLSDRIANAFVSYVIYIRKMIWPNDLAIFYPHPAHLPTWQVAGAVLFLIAVTLIVIRTAEKLPYLAVGWLWYVGTLVPVIGIVQVGAQARADRYTYIPLIGLFIVAAWGLPELSKKWRFRKEVLFASFTLSLLCFFIVTWTQVGYWQNSVTVFRHALEVTAPNSRTYIDLGAAYNNLGNYRKAIEVSDDAIKLIPKLENVYYNQLEKVYYNRGLAYSKLGDYKQALGDYDRAIEIDPTHAKAYNNRGIAYDILGNHRQAIGDFDKAIMINQKYAEAYYNRGIVYGRLGNYKQAIGDFDKAIGFNPKYAEAYYNRAASHYSLGNQRQAFEDLKTAARLGDEDAQNFLRTQGINW
ncbi:MAG: tetratricopeptide repeat protein [Syntrophales bacterium]